MACWGAFAREHIQEGDVLFRMGKAYGPYGYFGSHLVGNIGASPFSHDALAHWEGDKLWIYDAEMEGVRKILFQAWMFDVSKDTLAIKRLRPELRDRLPIVLAFCDECYRRNTPFDHGFHPGDEQLYCTEMLERAFQIAGIPLSMPATICSLPQYDRYKRIKFLVEHFTEIRVDVCLYSPGNYCHGAFSSPNLELIYLGKKAAATLAATGTQTPKSYCSLCVPSLWESFFKEQTSESHPPVVSLP
jgi:hypothetical protein